MRVAYKATNKYLACIKRFPLRPLRTEKECESAAKICDELLDNFDDLSAQERDYLEVLSKLVEDFEARFLEEKNVSPRELLVFLMEQNKLTQTDLLEEFGSSSRTSEYFSGKRELSLRQILKLSKRFNLSSAAFIARG